MPPGRRPSTDGGAGAPANRNERPPVVVASVFLRPAGCWPRHAARVLLLFLPAPRPYFISRTYSSSSCLRALPTKSHLAGKPARSSKLICRIPHNNPSGVVFWWCAFALVGEAAGRHDINAPRCCQPLIVCCCPTMHAHHRPAASPAPPAAALLISPSIS